MKKISIYIISLVFLGLLLTSVFLLQKKDENILENILQARKANASGQYIISNKYYKKAFKQDVENQQILQEYLLFSINNRKERQAINLAHLILQDDKNHLISNLMIMIEKLKNNQLKEAIALLNNIEGNVFIINLLKDILASVDSYGKRDSKGVLLTEEKLALIKELIPDFYYYHLAMLDIYNKNYQEAEEKLYYLSRNYSNIDAIINYSKLLNKHDNEKAIYTFDLYLNDNFIESDKINFYIKQKINIDLNSIISYALVRLSFLVSDELDSIYLSSDSFVFHNIAFMLDRNNNLAQLYIANFYEQISNYQKAISEYKKVSKKHFYHRQAREKIISIYSSLEYYDILVKFLRDERSKDKKNIKLSLELGNSYYKTNNYKKAITYYTKAKKMSEEQDSRLGLWLSYYYRGVAYDKGNNWNLAEKDLLKAYEIDSFDPLLINYLSYSWIDRDYNIEKAINLLEDALQRDENNYHLLDSYAWGLFKRKEYEKALEFVRKANSIYPYDDIINDHFGDILWQLGYKQEALNRWDIAFNLSVDKVLRNKITEKLQGVMPEYLNAEIIENKYNNSGFVEVSKKDK